MDSNVIGSYNNGNYNVILLKDGTKIRCNNADELIPDGFESCDMKIALIVMKTANQTVINAIPQNGLHC